MRRLRDSRPCGDERQCWYGGIGRLDSSHDSRDVLALKSRIEVACQFPPLDPPGKYKGKLIYACSVDQLARWAVARLKFDRDLDQAAKVPSGVGP